VAGVATGIPARVVAMLFALAVISYFDRTVLSIAAPTIMREHGLSETQMGWVLSAFLWSYALFQIPGGRWSDRFGPRATLTGMAAGSGLFTALMAAASSVTGFFALRLGFGVATAPLFPAVNKTNAALSSPPQRGLVQGLVASGAGLGAALSPLAVTWMIGWSGWRAAFAIAGGITMAAAWVWWRAADTDMRSAIVPKASWRKLARNRNLAWLTVGFTLLDYYEYIFFYWIFYYLGEVRKLPANESAWYTTMLFLTWLVMTPLGGWYADALSRRWGRHRGMRAAAVSTLLASAVALYAGVGSTQTLPAVALMSLAFGLAACADVNFWASTIEVMGDEAGAAGGILNAGGNLGGAVAPVLTPYIASKFGWEWGLYFGSAMAIGGAAVWLFIRPNNDNP
jgi:ACS family glucarate transporter-like MFS transporter